MSQRWHAAVAYALVGAELPLTEDGRSDPHDVVAGLTSLGWTGERIGTHAREVAASGLAWPHPVPAALRSGCGAAQLHASLDRTRELLGLVSLDVLPPSRRTELTPDERRLMAEVPPHHVH